MWLWIGKSVTLLSTTNIAFKKKNVFYCNSVILYRCCFLLFYCCFIVVLSYELHTLTHYGLSVYFCLSHIHFLFTFLFTVMLFSYQSLTLLEYLLKTGDDRVLLKMKDNIYIVKALTEYRFVEKDGKDQVIHASW